MSKKAQGLSMTVIIVAAIALLVLVILSIIFIGRMGKTTESIDQCKGRCVSTADDCTGAYSKITSDPCFEPGSRNIDTANPICCVSI